MNPAVASYILLFISAVVCIGVSLRKFVDCLNSEHSKNHKPAMLSIFICTSWAIVAANGMWTKWFNPEAKLTIDTPILVLLITATIYALIYTLDSFYRYRRTWV